MTINGYIQQIDDIVGSTLPPADKRAALELTATEIEGAAWQPPYRALAHETAARARAAAALYPDGGLQALDSLAAKGLLRRKAGA